MKKTMAKTSFKLHGDFAIKIVKLNVEKLIQLLNKAYADEWLAYHQYWTCAKLVEGPQRSEVITELNQHAQEEYQHLEKITTRIIQLGGTPLKTPAEWYKHAGCTYKATENLGMQSVLEENIKGEQCAIQFYDGLLRFIGTKDPITYDMILQILNDELEHEQDLTLLLQEFKAL